MFILLTTFIRSSRQAGSGGVIASMYLLMAVQTLFTQDVLICAPVCRQSCATVDAARMEIGCVTLLA
jgi:hypothetical protein